MRIGMLGPISWRTPPRHYGPWEQIVSDLTEGLVRRGVDVTLFATADSLTKAKLSAVCPRPYSEDGSLDAKVWEMMHIANAFEHAGEFDLIHNHFDFTPLTFTRLVNVPVVTTIHGFSSKKILPAYIRYDDRVHYVAISNADRSPELNYAATIHHGIPIDNFAFSNRAEDYLLFFGRIHPDKGAAHAVALAQSMKRRLKIAGIIQDQDYYDKWVRPHIGNGIEYLGPVGVKNRAKLLGGASCLLHLIEFDEPFGLSVVEAMACGTPVVAFSRGSMPEIIQPDVNGFLINDLCEASDAVATCDNLDRATVRKSVETRFNVDRMVDEYISLYKSVLES